jgi:HK97 family phage prohead protease
VAAFFYADDTMTTRTEETLLHCKQCGSKTVKYLSISEWKQSLAAGESVDAAIMKVYVADDVKTLEDRQVQVVISTGVVDRDKDTISPLGWDLKNFQKAGGPVLFAHDYRSLPVAKSVKVWVEDSQLKAVAQFATAEEYAFADTVYRMIKGGFLRAASVGFRPLKSTYNEEQGGYEISKSELLEWSFCPVGANPEAIVEAKSAGIDLRPFTDWCEQYLDQTYGGKGVWVPREQVEAVFKAMNNTTMIPVARSQELEGAIIIREEEVPVLRVDLEVSDEPTIMIDEEDLQRALADLGLTIQQQLVGVATRAAHDELNYARGRVA